MTVLGIDPGTATTGFAVVTQTGRGAPARAVEYGVVSTDKGLSDAERLTVLAEDLRTLLARFRPDAAAVEKLYFETNAKTAMAVSQARGVALLVCAEAGLPLFEYTPLQVKNFICGYGKADKKQVQFVVQQTFRLKSLPKPDDAADALAVALCGLHHAGKTAPRNKTRGTA